jgi:hypothetical protein
MQPGCIYFAQDMRMERQRAGVRSALWGVVALVWVGCVPVGEGEVRVKVSGEEAARRGYAAGVLEDGWTIRFDKYLVSLGDFALTSAGGERRVMEGEVVVDLQKGEVELGRMEGLPAGRWGVGFRVGPPGEGAARPDGYVSEEDAERMKENGYAYWLEGEAVKPQVGTYRFQLGLPLESRMEACTNGADGKLGVVVPEGSAATAEITVHVEHLFYDRLGTHRGVKMRFEAFAAAADGNRLITLERLATQDLLDLRGVDGGELRDAEGRLVVYEPGAYAVRTLKDFVLQSVVDQAHLNGGGVCEVVGS